MLDDGFASFSWMNGFNRSIGASVQQATVHKLELNLEESSRNLGTLSTRKVTPATIGAKWPPDIGVLFGK